MSLLQRFPILCLLNVGLAIAAFALVEAQVWLAGVAGMLTVMSWYVTEGPRGRTLPRWLANILIIGVTIWMVFDLIEHRTDIPGVLGRFAIGLIVVKLFERRTSRDHAHLLALGLLLVLVGCSRRDPPLLFGLTILLYLALGVYVLLLFRLFAAQEQHVGLLRSRPEAVLASSRPVAGRSAALHLVLLTGAIAVAGLLLSVTVFVAFPRSLGRGMLAPAGLTTSTETTTGYADDIDLVHGARITESPRPVMRVVLKDGDGNPVVLEEGLYLRGNTMSTYRDRKWSDTRPVTSALAPEDNLLTPGLVDRRSVLQQTIDYMRPTANVFSAYVPVRTVVDGAARLSFDRMDQTIRTARAGASVRSSVVESWIDPPEPAVAFVARLVRPPRAMGPYRDREGPEARRVRELALEIVEAAGLPTEPPERERRRGGWNLAVAEALAAHFAFPRFRYDLDLRDVTADPEVDPIVHFLFESHRGHCEFYASALTVMCHTLGIDARIVAGYLVTEPTGEAGTYVVRASHAHAWVEVPTSGYLFDIVDPTPPQLAAVSSGPDVSIATRFEWFYDDVEGTWNDSFVGFDADLQGDLLAAVNEGGTQRVAEWWRGFKDWASQINRTFQFGPAGYIWLGIVAFAIALAVIALVGALRRRGFLRRSMQLEGLSTTDARRYRRQLAFYPDLLSILARGGIEKPSWQAPLAFADELRDRRPELAEPVRVIAELYYAGRFGGRDLTGDDRTVARAELARVSELIEGNAA